MTILAQIWFALGFFLIGISFIVDLVPYTAAGAAFALGMSWATYQFWVKNSGSTIFNPSKKSQSPIVPEEQGNTKRLPMAIASLREKQKKSLRDLEDNLDSTLTDALAVLRNGLSANTLAIFFPDGGSGIYLRIWLTSSQSIVPGATIRAGQGLVGILLKDGSSRILEHDIVTPSTQLYYYSQDEAVKSIAGIPIMVQGIRRGAIIADSLKTKAFNNNTIEVLESFSKVIGRLMFYGYLSYETGYQRDQLAALSSYQRKFLKNMSESEIIVYIQQYVEQSLDSDRMMLIAKSRTQPEIAHVLFCSGIDEKYWHQRSFEMADNALITLVFQKEQIINKSILKGEKLPRLSTKERMNNNFKSLLAVPFRTDQGITHVLLVESVKRRWFSEHQKELLVTIARASGFALARARLFKEKELLSQVDGLTGLINHKTFHESYQKAVLKAQRTDGNILILMLDIDYFKKVNDTFGHPVGDIVLKETARIIQNTAAFRMAEVARYGGEEFVCMIENISEEKARLVAERIRGAVEHKAFDVGQGKILKVTLSIGGAIYPQDSKRSAEILDRADKALYIAKKNGRNQIVFVSDG